MNNINGGNPRRRAMANVDLYRRVPRDLTEATTLGAFMSVVALSVMAVLFVSETMAFIKTDIVTSISLDENTRPKIRVNFNITVPEINCDYVSLDVWDALGTNRQNVTRNVDKWHLNSEGVRMGFKGRNREDKEVEHEEHERSLEEMHEEEGDQAVDLTKETFDAFLRDNQYAFVDMFAPWCVWCQRLAPTWQAMATEIKKQELNVAIGKIDCVAQADLCRSQKIMAFPTLRWFEKGGQGTVDYKMDRTVDALVTFVKSKLPAESEEIDKATKRKLDRNNDAAYAGCMVSGYLMVNRVPGNFHIEARSKSHNINAAMTNLTHVVNHLSFGDPIDHYARRSKRILKQVPEEHQQFSPIDGESYLTREFHQAHHHYIKVVSTHLNMGAKNSTNSLVTYQFTEQSRMVSYDVEDIPEARFSYDLSPMSVIVEKESRKWYDYLTSLCAIIGGTFTTLGLIDATLYKVLKPKKI